MGAAYSQDLRDRILAAYDRGMKTKQVAKMFEVCCSWARRVKQVRRESGRTGALPMGGVRVVKIDLEHLRRLVAQQPDATVRELHERLGCDCGESAVDMALRRLELTLKKRRSMPPSRIGPMWPTGASTGRPRSPASRPGG